MQIEREHYPLLTAICASLFCTPMMVAGINAVLPEIGASLHAGATQLGLVGASYSLGLAIFQLACGSFGDIYGHKRIFLCGGVIFCLSGIIQGCLNSINIFLIFRFAQGIGGAMLSATGLALLASSAPPGKRALYLGLSGTAVYAGIACGPPIAGFIAGSIGWRWIFWINSIAAFVVWMLMKYRVSHEWRPSRGKIFDWWGCLFYSLSMSSLTLAASMMGQDKFSGTFFMASFVLFMIVFCLWETRSHFPMLNLALLTQNRVLALSSLAAFINYASFFGMIFYFSLYVQVGKGMNVLQTGFILAVQPLIQSLCTPLATRLCNSWPEGMVSALGAALCGLGLIVASMLSLQSTIFYLFAAQTMLGCGMSLFALANTAIILESAGRPNVGQASALTGAMRTSGQLVSMVLITLTLSFFLGNVPVSPSVMPGFMQSMRFNLVIFGILNLTAIAMSLARNKLVK